jgi:hypothetical protein
MPPDALTDAIAAASASPDSSINRLNFRRPATRGQGAPSGKIARSSPMTGLFPNGITNFKASPRSEILTHSLGVRLSLRLYPGDKTVP